MTYLVPIFAVLLGALVLGERLTWHQPVGALVVLLGVAVAQGLVGPRRTRAAEVPPADAAPPATGAVAGAAVR